MTGSLASWRQAQGGPISIAAPVDDDSRIGEARRAADALASDLGLSEETRGVIGVVVTEAATNLARHAREGVIYLRGTGSSGPPGIEILAVDHGPGMSNVALSSVDGYSTGGTSGHGLGAMRRMAHEFDVYSRPGVGTALVARVFDVPQGTVPAHPPAVRVGVICRPIAGETVCGDGWAVAERPGRTVVLLVDGLGHGPVAAEAADCAREVFAAAHDGTPKEILLAMHGPLHATRGAAALVIEIVPRGEGAAAVTVAGAGNISCAVVTGDGAKALPSVNGTVGHVLRDTREFRADWPAGSRLIAATDGLTTRWRLGAYPGICFVDPALAAAVLHRDHSRGRDDVTVLALALSTAAR